MGDGQAVLVTGAAGRIGRLLALHEADFTARSLRPHWLTRARWDLAAPPPPDLPRRAVLLNLSGAVPGRGVLSDNVDQARAIVAADAALSFRHVLHMSSAAVLAPGPRALGEDVPPAPLSPYGAAKAEAEALLLAGLPGRVTILRLGNLAGADALLGGNDPGTDVVLDPVPGQVGGPLRSWIGPLTLARVMAALAAGAEELPPILNLAQPGVVAMAELLDAAGRRWHYGPPRSDVVARVELATGRLGRFCAHWGCPLPPATAQGIVGELLALKGRWP